MSKRFTLVYLGLAPVLFGLSWYIAHRLHERFMTSAGASSDDRSLIYSSAFAALYIGAYFVIRDLYREEGK